MGLTASNLEEFASFACHLADAARQVQFRWYRTSLGVEDKSDTTPVTIADRETETCLRGMIRQQYPEHGIIGEEYEAQQTSSPFTWVIDPIDGTRSFMIGRPTFATLIALAHEGRPVVGIIDQAIVGDRWLGIEGVGTSLNGEVVRTRGCANIRQAILLTTSPDMFETGMERQAFRKLKNSTKDIVYGGDAIGYGLVASGHADIVLESHLEIFDFMALVPVIENAGGSITDWYGEPLSMKSTGNVLALGDPTLLPEAIALLDPHSPPIEL